MLCLDLTKQRYTNDDSSVTSNFMSSCSSPHVVIGVLQAAGLEVPEGLVDLSLHAPTLPIQSDDNTLCMCSRAGRVLTFLQWQYPSSQRALSMCQDVQGPSQSDAVCGKSPMLTIEAMQDRSSQWTPLQQTNARGWSHWHSRQVEQ